jgi:LysR family transcriptional regulator, regulator for bpeEF and oprC
MTLEQLRAFVKIVQAGSFTRAAEQLATQKGHLSRVLSQLERELGVKLLERSTRALSLTEVGREVFERAIGILGAVEDTTRLTQQLQGEPRGVLRLTCGVEFGMLAVSRWIDGFLRRYPDISVDADFTARLVDVVHEGFDLAIRLGELRESRLAARRLGELRYGLYACPDYLRRRGAPASVEELRAHPLLMFTTGVHRTGWRLSAGGEEARIDGPARLRVNNVFAILNAALAGLGVAQLPDIVAAEAVEGGRLVRVLPTAAPEPVPVHAVFPSGRYLTPKVRAFIDHAIGAFPDGSLAHGSA